MKLVALVAGVLGVPIENDYVPAPMVIGGTQVNHWSSIQEINNLDRINLLFQIFTTGSTARADLFFGDGLFLGNDSLLYITK